MSEPTEILRIAARGDGLTMDGRHVAGAAPGDTIAADGSVTPGSHHVDPPCRHFGTCGGCQLQHCDDETLSAFVTDRVIHAAQGQGLTARTVAPTHLSPPHSRRRATLHAINGGGGRALIGFRENGSHRLVDVKECPVLHPALLEAVSALRALLSPRKGRFSVDIELTLADQGVDAALKGLSVEGLQQTEALLDFARESGLARLTLDQGFGPETMWEPEPVTVSLAGISVPLPPGAFLQATSDAEAALAEAAVEWLQGCSAVADLFSGLGTFAFALAQGTKAKVLAAEAARDAHLACKAAAGRAGLPVHAMHRDLFRNPLLAEDLARFDAVLLDPPRAGAREQVSRLATSDVERIVYISCNPASWARDARTLADGAYSLTELRPVGQFRWSTHVELASLFVRERAD